MFRTRADYELSLLSRTEDEEAAIMARLARRSRIDYEMAYAARVRFAEANGGTGRSGVLSVKYVNGELDVGRQGEPHDELRNY